MEDYELAALIRAAENYARTNKETINMQSAQISVSRAKHGYNRTALAVYRDAVKLNPSDFERFSEYSEDKLSTEFLYQYGRALADTYL